MTGWLINQPVSQAKLAALHRVVKTFVKWATDVMYRGKVRGEHE